MQHVTSLSFLLLAYSNYLSHANKVVPCGDTNATPALLKHLAKRQVSFIHQFILGWDPIAPFSTLQHQTKLTAIYL
jgi:hypothetical protein